VRVLVCFILVCHWGSCPAATRCVLTASYLGLSATTATFQFIMQAKTVSLTSPTSDPQAIHLQGPLFSAAHMDSSENTLHAKHYCRRSRSEDKVLIIKRHMLLSNRLADAAYYPVREHYRAIRATHRKGCLTSGCGLGIVGRYPVVICDGSGIVE
jgi:hypothetical protein